jgi:phage/plasmid-like protein (TIGR03299 family)
MAHNLATAGDKVLLAYRDRVPWHHLGHSMTDEESRDYDAAVRAAGLDYGVAVQPMYLRDGREVPQRRAVLRVDTQAILGTVGSDYVAVPNAEALGVGRGLIEHYHYMVETAGALRAGERAWMLLTAGETHDVAPRDSVRCYVLLMTTHDGTTKISARPVRRRVVCENTLDMALAEGNQAYVAVSHRGSVKERLAEARLLLERLETDNQRAVATYRDMAARPLSLDELTAYWQTVFPHPQPDAADESRAVVADLLLRREEERPDRVQERRDAVAWLLDNGAGSELAGAGQTVWGALNAVAEWVDHVYPSRRDGSLRQNGAASALFGQGARVRQRAHAAAVALVR